MAFYVPLGVRGILFQAGTLLITVFGGLVYWRASRRRGLAVTPMTVTFDFVDGELVPFVG